VSALFTPLLSGGAGGLGHWRLTRSGGAPVPPLHETYRALTLEAKVREWQLSEAVSVLRGAGIEALLGKGWAVARHYAQPGLRPYGDLDLFVPPAARAQGLRVLQDAGRPLPVDLHAGFAELDDRGAAALHARAITADVAGVPVRIFGTEDHLRLLALHLLRHGASRPIWLCDLGALLEAAPAPVDWDLVLSGPKHLARSVAGAIALAARLLEARVGEADAQRAAGLEALPDWLEPAVLEQWGSGVAFRRAVADQMHEPVQLLRGLRQRWPNALEATAGLAAPFDDGPRWPYQAGYAAVRTLRFLRARLSRVRG